MIFAPVKCILAQNTWELRSKQEVIDPAHTEHLKYASSYTTELYMCCNYVL